MLSLIRPMEPMLIEDLPHSDDYFYQVKWDGVRILAYIDKGKVQLYTRKQQPRTEVYPEITEALALQFPNERLILDGEMVTIHNGRSDFYQLMKRDRLQDPVKIQSRMKTIPVSYMVFDLLLYNKEWFFQVPLIDRLNRLQQILTITDQIQGCYTTEDGESLYQYAVQKNWEGVVAKERLGLYYPGQKHTTWRKWKNFQLIQAQVIGVIQRAKQVASFLLAVEVDGEWIYIGKVATGLSQVELTFIQEIVDRWKVDHSILEQPPRFPRDTIHWLSPQLTVQVKFLEWTPDGTLRSPVIQGFIRTEDT